MRQSGASSLGGDGGENNLWGQLWKLDCVPKVKQFFKRFAHTSGYVHATAMCLKSNGLKVIGLHRTTTKKYHLLRDGTTQQRETEEFYDLQLTKGSSTSSIFSLPYRHSTKARAQLLFLDPGWSRHSDSPPPLSS